MQEAGKLGHVANVDVLASGERMVERDVYAAIAVLDVEDHGIAADFAPVLDDAYPVVTSCHDAGQVDGANLEIFGDRDRLLDDGRRQDSWHDQLLPCLQVVTGAVAIRL